MKTKAIEVILLTLLLIGTVTLVFNLAIAGVDETESAETDETADVSVTQTIDWWPMFHHDPRHTGYSTSTAPKTNHTVWNYTIGDLVRTSPAVAEGRVYVGSDDNRVYCLDASTGTHIWNYTTGDVVLSSPAVADDKVYVGSQDDKVYCLNASTGTFIWSYKLGGSGVWSDPVVIDGKVYVGASSSGKSVYCLNASTGAHIWSYTTGDWVDSSPALAYGNVYVGSGGTIYCLDAATGAHVWNYTTGDIKVSGSPAVAEGRVYVGSGYNVNKVYCLNASTGAHIWNYTPGGWVKSSPALAYGNVYVGADDYKIYCFNAITGDFIWNYTTGSALVESSPAVADGKVYLGTKDNRVYCLDASTGTHIWNYKTGAWCESSPAVADGRVYIGSNDGKLYAFGLAVTLPVHNIDTDLDYETIQEAIDAPETLNGHTIFVEDGIYYDPVLVDKSLSLIGEDRSTTTVEANYVGTIFNLTASNVKITGFTIQHGAFPEPIDFGIYVNPSSANNNISYNNIITNGHGIYLETSSDNTISGNRIQNCHYGIYSYQSSDNTISKNDIEDNSVGIFVEDFSDYNTISENNIKLNYGGGLGVSDSSKYNTISGNNIEMNEYGIQLIDSSDNSIYHNDFIDNTQQMINENSINTWDDGYPSGGNYWKDHNPPDIYSGPNQDVEGTDTIGDIPFVIDENNQDNYPLIYPYGWVPSPDINNDGIVDIFDIVILANAFGSYPGHPYWNPVADVKGPDGVIDIFDIVLVAKYFGSTWPPSTS